jgi:hypothetical protein
MKPSSSEEDKPGFESPQAPLEQMFIDEYLKGKGYNSIKELCHLPENEAKQLMIDACRFASGKLAEIESRAGFQQKIHYEG